MRSLLRSHHLLTLAVIALLGIGLMMVQSASMQVTGHTDALLTDAAAKHVRFVVLGLVAFFVAMRLPVEQWIAGNCELKTEDAATPNDVATSANPQSAIRNPQSTSSNSQFAVRIWQFLSRSPAFWTLVTAGFLCFLVLVPHIGSEVNGARRWIKIGPIQLQPSELAKWATVISLAWWLTRRPIDLSKFTGFLLTLAPIGVLALLVVIEDFGTAALIGMVTLLMLVVGRVKTWHLAVVIPPALGAAAFFVMGTPYRWKRMTSFLDPWQDPRGDGYHMIQSLMSFASGGFTGRGLGNGIQKLGYLPEDTTDFIFAVICEELGFFGAATVVALYLAIVVVAWRLIRDDRVSPLGKLLSFGIASTIGLQACINLAVATVSMPTKGMSLPLISAGGTGIVLACAMLGAMAGIARARPVEETADLPEEASEPVTA
ncbi:MAG: putative peptidoglycan glycosyltransferase FtsW [Tepidisphaeraceae bacterium]